MAKSPNPNRELLDPINAADLWFAARKVASIKARRVDAPQTVQTLEGEEQINAGDYLCQGTAGELWPQSASALDAKYVRAGEPDAEGWCKYVPNPDTAGVVAAQVDHLFAVVAKWGTLSGKPGDYVVKNLNDKDVTYPDDIWIVDQQLFQTSYQNV